MSIYYTSQNFPFPKLAYIDTNAFMEIISNRRYSPEVQSFITKAGQNNSILTYSDHVLDEIYECLNVSVLKDEMSRAGFVSNSNNKAPDWKQFESSPGINVGNITNQKFENFLSLMNRIGADLFYKLDNPPSEQLRSTTMKFVSHGNSPKDAKHLAIAHHHGINDIFTIDGGFTKSPNMNVYGPSIYFRNNSTNSALPNPFIETIPDC